MILRKIATSSLIVPAFDSELKLDERGLIASIVNNYDADFQTIEGISSAINLPISKFKATLYELVNKGYLIHCEDIFIVNKSKLKDMLFLEQAI